MTYPRSKAVRPVSPLLAIVASLVIAVHFGLIAVRALANPSGPWPSPEGMSMAPPPRFAWAMNEEAAQGYLGVVRLSETAPSPSQRPAKPGVYLEARLRDADGNLLTTIRLPDPQASRWVRYRQELLVQEFVPDMPMAPPAGEAVPAPNQAVRQVAIWDLGPNRALQLRRTPEHLVPRNRPVFAPGEWSLVLARSYARYLCRTHGAASAELIRHSRDTLPPTAWLTGTPPPDAFENLIANYGKNLAD